MKVNFIKKNGNRLLVYIKMPFFRTPKKIDEELMQFEDNYISYLGWKLDDCCKYVIATFVLRNIKDIEPYIEKLEEK